MTKRVDPKKYCTYLVRPPPRIGLHHESGGADEFYFCRLTDKPCIARDITVLYMEPEIDEKMLETCPAHNLPKKIARSILEHRIRHLKASLDEKLKG